MLYEGNEDFLREYELRTTNSFLDFHSLIQDSVSFSNKELASFFICDGEWNRRLEITLLDMQDEAAEEGTEPVMSMDRALLRDFMEEPRQRIIYEYDFLNPKSFFIELTAVAKDDPEREYPRCLYSRADLSPELPAEEDEQLEVLDPEDLDELLRDLGADFPEGDLETEG